MPTKTITKTEQGEILFLSRGPATRLVRLGRESIYSSAGTYMGDKPGKFYEFRDHQLRVRPGKDVMPDGPLDESGEPTEQDVVSWLRNHPGFNGGEANAFSEHGVVLKADDPGPLLDQIMSFAIYGDVEGIEGLLAEERSGPNREIVLERGLAALDTVRAALAAPAPDAPENG